MLVIGVTGGTGAGKTTFSDAVIRHGGTAIDCDVLYAELLRSDSQMKEKLSRSFGDIFRPDGTLDRKILARVVFSSEEQMKKLNEIVFEHILRAVDAEIAKAKEKKTPYFVIDAINLVQSGLAQRCDTVVGVLAPREERLKRIIERDKLQKPEAEARINAQEPDGFYAKNCSYLLKNTGGETEFSLAAERLFEQIIKECNA